MQALNINWSPKAYDDAAIVAEKAGNVLFQQLDWMVLQPEIIVEVGAGTGKMSQQLCERYPNASVLTIDSSFNMLTHATQYDTTCVCAEASALPLADSSADLLYANFLLPWHSDMHSLFTEWRRILKPDGLVLLTALGPDTLREQREILGAPLPNLLDIHDIGDALIQAGFADPVLEVGYYTVSYREKNHLLLELKASGMIAEEVTAHIPETQQVTYEVIFAHAFIPEISQQETKDNVTTIPLSTLRKQLRR